MGKKLTESSDTTQLKKDLQMEVEVGIPRPSTNIISKLTFWWVTPLIRLASSRPLQHNDLWHLPKYLTAEYNYPRFDEQWKKQKEKNPEE